MRVGNDGMLSSSARSAMVQAHFHSEWCVKTKVTVSEGLDMHESPH